MTEPVRVDEGALKKALAAYMTSSASEEESMEKAIRAYLANLPTPVPPVEGLVERAATILRAVPNYKVGEEKPIESYFMRLAQALAQAGLLQSRDEVLEEIETAPRDRTPIVAARKSITGEIEMRLAYWGRGDHWFGLNDEMQLKFEPTHWHRIPKTLAEKNDDQAG